MASAEEWMKFAEPEPPVAQAASCTPLEFNARLQCISASLEKDKVTEVHAKLPEQLFLTFH
jgi:hypothetical protein